MGSLVIQTLSSYFIHSTNLEANDTASEMWISSCSNFKRDFTKCFCSQRSVAGLVPVFIESCLGIDVFAQTKGSTVLSNLGTGKLESPDAL